MRQPLYGEHNYTQELSIQVRSHERLLRMCQPLYGDHNYTQELSIQVRSHERLLRMRQPLYGEHNYTHELNIQVRSHDRISAHVCQFPVYTGSVSGKHSQTYKTPHLGTYPLRHIYLSFVYLCFANPRTEYCTGRSPLFTVVFCCSNPPPPQLNPFSFKGGPSSLYLSLSALCVAGKFSPFSLAEEVGVEPNHMTAT
jgi:hypothetical protein